MRGLGWVCLLFATGCFDPKLIQPDAAPGGVADARPGQPGPDGCTTCASEVVAELPAGEPTRELDLLFVIDNSNSMIEEQEALTDAFPDFAAALAGGGGGMPDLHIGVVSSDLGTGYFSEACFDEGDDGILQNTPRGSCSPPDGRFIVDVADGAGRDRNYSGSLSDVFRCIAELGDDGCGVEQHLLSMKLALDGSRPENAGFLRAGSFLGVVILADEDDCSASDTRLFNPALEFDNIDSIYGPYTSFRCAEFGVECDGGTLRRSAASYTRCNSRHDSPYLFPPSVHGEFLRSLRPLTHLFVAAIVGPSSPFSVATSSGKPLLVASCTGLQADADPAVRLNELAASFYDHGASVSICSDDLRGELAELGRRISTRLAGRCIAKPVVDVSPAPGVQADCEVWQYASSGEPTPIPACGGSSGQLCFELIADPIRCPYAPGTLRVQVQRSTAAPAGASYIVQCRTH